MSDFSSSPRENPRSALPIWIRPGSGNFFLGAGAATRAHPAHILGFAVDHFGQRLSLSKERLGPCGNAVQIGGTEKPNLEKSDSERKNPNFLLCTSTRPAVDTDFSGLDTDLWRR
jgi:hypothetical protein